MPALYNVSDVAHDDTLNLRAAPSAQGAVLGGIAYDAQDIEVVQTDADGRWGLVNHGETAGWVSMRFLQRQAGQWVDGVPSIKSCFGTEPFWSFEVDEAGGTWSTPTGVTGFQLGVGTKAAGRTNVFGFSGTRTTANGGQLLTNPAAIVVHQRTCNDGMSDRAFGLDVSVFFNQRSGDQQSTLLTGCCSVAP